MYATRHFTADLSATFAHTCRLTNIVKLPCFTQIYIQYTQEKWPFLPRENVLYPVKVDTKHWTVSMKKTVNVVSW